MLVFTNKSHQPSQNELEKALGEHIHFYNAMLQACDIDKITWKYYSKSSGWTLQCRQDGRSLFYIQVTDDGFYVWFTLDQEAKNKAVEQVVNKKLKKEIAEAREYKEGTSFKIEAKAPRDLYDIMILSSLKVEGVKR